MTESGSLCSREEQPPRLWVERWHQLLGKSPWIAKTRSLPGRQPSLLDEALQKGELVFASSQASLLPRN